jgi:hypothetical protein
MVRLTTIMTGVSVSGVERNFILSRKDGYLYYHMMHHFLIKISCLTPT